MWKITCVLILLSACCCSAGPLAGQQRKNMPIRAREDSAMAMQTQESETVGELEMPAAETETAAAAAPLVGTLTLPSNATSIRADITDSFSCANKSYGYYADVENDCQIFHVCLPVTYADGKENTFRWSFICPEETIFSQESFTCMRREDMTIECEESYRYYDLNGNFGATIEEEKQPAAVETDSQVDESDMPAEPAATAAAAPEVPAVEPAKPVKVQKPKPKPNRRKPAVTYNKPQRKVPAPATAAPVMPEPVEEPEPAPAVIAPVVAKPPKPSRFNPRPNKEKPQAIKPAVPATATPIRNELFHSIRKRPAMFNKHSSTSTKPIQSEAEPAPTEVIPVQAELSEPQPTLKLQTMFVDAPVMPEEPLGVASEPVVAIAKPEEPESEPETVSENKVQAEPEPEPQNEAEIETQPEVHAESQPETQPEPQAEAQPEVQYEAQPEAENEVMTEAKPEAQPEVHSEDQVQILPEAILESLPVVESTKPEETVEQLEPLKLEFDEVKPIEAIEEIPAVIVETQQPEEPSGVQPEVIPVITADQASTTVDAEPAIVEPSSSNEESLNNLEAMEAAKPEDAPVSLPATPEMANPNPLVEEMLDNSSPMSEAQESLGGFKPVDPVMAAEAEQLINDFLNTLRKNEEKSETEMTAAAMDMAETIEHQPQIIESDAKPAPVAELLQPTSDVSIEEAKLPEPDSTDKEASVEEQLIEAEQEPEPQPKLKLKLKDSPIINIMQLNHLPADYQIPVQVVAVPEVEVQPEQPQQEAIKEPETAESELKPVETDATPEISLPAAAYMPPISIDDIVELVKERLDQNPKNEQPAPMELVLTPGAAAPMTLIESGSHPEMVQAAEPQPEPASESVPEAAQPFESISQPAEESEQEETILPIYKRISIAEPSMSKVQTLPVTVSKVDDETKPEEEAAVSKTRMDARKRRFLFRADAS